MIRTKGEAGTGDVVFAVRHMRQIIREMRALTVLSEQELYAAAKEHQAPYELIRMVAQTGKLPVPNFSAGGIATPADAALMMQLGAEAIFVGSGIFMKERATPLDVENDPKEREEAVSRAKAIVIATTHYNDPKILAEVAEQVTGTMKGLAAAALEEKDQLQTRGWCVCRTAGDSLFARKNSSLHLGAVFASSARPILALGSAWLYAQDPIKHWMDRRTGLKVNCVRNNR
jgi:pyridoxal 5'-phosphate synthase pdxS subunit